MASNAILAAAGLVTSPNQLNTQEGSLSEANNVVIRREGIIEQRRGMTIYGDSLPAANQRVKQITSYRERIIRHYNNKLQVDSTGQGRFLDIVGNVTETESGLRVKFTESNGNLYFTTSEGIKKLSAKDKTQIPSMNIETSGIETGLDIQSTVKIIDNLQSGFLPQDSKVAYRVVWNRLDKNNNLITGAPSQREIASLSMTELIIRDTMRLLQELDSLENLDTSTARIDDKNYLESLKLTLSSQPSEVRANLIALANKLDNDIILAKASVINASPVKIQGVELTDGTVTITFLKEEQPNLAALNALAVKNSYVIYKALDTSKLYYWNGSSFIERETLKDYFSSTLNIILSGFELSTRSEIQTINFTTIPDSGTLTIKYNNNESDAIPLTATNEDIKSTISKVAGLELISSVSGSFSTGFILTFASLAGDLQQINVGPATNLQTGSTFVTVETATTQTGISKVQGDLNGKQTVLNVSENTVTFSTTAIGSAGISANAEIRYHEFRSITEPVETSNPATNTELLSLQIYFDTILQTLQNTPSSIIAEYPEQEYVNLASFPATGQTKIIYKAQDTSKTYIWNGSSYVEGTDDKDKIYTISLTTSANVQLTFTIPETITTNDFYQLYRSSISQALEVASLDELVVSDEMKLVFEAYPTQDEIDQKSITILDETPDIFRGANLYTNASTGEGILQANYQAPFAKDINRYRNTVFYANTRTKNKLQLNLLPVENLIQNYSELDKPKLTITNGQVTNTYTFITGKKESIEIIVNTTSISSKSFKLTSARGTKYRIYFDTVTGLQSDEIGLKITSAGLSTTQQIAKAISNKISTLLDDFIVSYNDLEPNKIIITDTIYGEVNDSSDVDTGFSILVINQGRGAKLDGLNVLLSTQVSIGQAVDETAKSLVEIINKNLDETVYAFYVSATDDVPGKIFLESRTLQDTNPFYVSTNSEILGKSFNPDIRPDFLITDISTISTKTTVTVSANHGLITGDEVVISGSNSTPSIDGIHTITKVTDTQFTISFAITSSGNSGSVIKKAVALVSENEEKMNRVYYSKYNQPEAVPIVNYMDLGSSDKKILRILPLRDSLFVFKEDGLFRISGDSPSFQSELFDNSYILLAPDSIDVCNNVVYGWTTQGIQALTEGGASVISRNIDNIILKTQSSNYINFKTSTWGIGYESDNSYLVFTVQSTQDEVAQIAYRFSTLTNTWTTYDKSYSCGHIANFDDHFYAGATDIAYIEKERKTFTRMDYSDREYDIVLSPSAILNKKVKLPSVADFDIGDVLVQEQTVTQYDFNQLLNKLDLDDGPSLTYSDLVIVTEAEALLNQNLTININLRQSLLALAARLDSDNNIISSDFLNSIETKTGNISSIDLGNETIVTCSSPHGLLDGRILQITGSDSNQSIDGIHKITVIDSLRFKVSIPVTVEGTTGSWETVDDDFNDLKVCYNKIINILNLDEGVNFINYREITNNTLQEAIIIDVNIIKKELTLNIELSYLEGAAKIFKAINSSISYSPNTFGDPLNLKHLREATLMLETRTLSFGNLAFSTDLLPEFVQIVFALDGNGIFGHQNFGDNYFGGLSNSAPFRTYIPRQCQRCRYIICKFSHSVAREDWRLLGMTLTGEVQQSTRAFR